MDFASIAKFRKDITIKEHASGKIRLGFKASLMLNPDMLKFIKDAPREKPRGITKTNFSMLSRTATIEYDENLIPKELLERALTVQDENEMIKALTALYDVVFKV